MDTARDLGIFALPRIVADKMLLHDDVLSNREGRVDGSMAVCDTARIVVAAPILIRNAATARLTTLRRPSDRALWPPLRATELVFIPDVEVHSTCISLKPNPRTSVWAPRLCVKLWVAGETSGQAQATLPPHERRTDAGPIRQPWTCSGHGDGQARTFWRCPIVSPDMGAGCCCLVGREARGMATGSNCVKFKPSKHAHVLICLLQPVALLGLVVLFHSITWNKWLICPSVSLSWLKTTTEHLSLGRALFNLL